MHIPLEKLPVDIQKRIVAYLQAGNFIAAKDIRDEYEQTAKEKWKKRLKPPRNGGRNAYVV